MTSRHSPNGAARRDAIADQILRPITPLRRTGRATRAGAEFLCRGNIYPKFRKLLKSLLSSPMKFTNFQPTVNYSICKFYLPSYLRILGLPARIPATTPSNGGHWPPTANCLLRGRQPTMMKPGISRAETFCERPIVAIHSSMRSRLAVALIRLVPAFSSVSTMAPR